MGCGLMDYLRGRCFLKTLHLRNRILLLCGLVALCLVVIGIVHREINEELPRIYQTPVDSRYKSSNSSNLTVFTVLYWNQFFSSDDFYVGFGTKPFRQCNFQNCFTTKNKKEIINAEAVIFHIRNAWLPIYHRNLDQKYVYFSKESPANVQNLSYLNGFFNTTMTYRLDSDVVNSYFEVVEGEMLGELPSLPDKTKPVAWVVSHCYAQSQREKYVERLQNYIDVDIYGACGLLSCPAKGMDCHRLLAKSHYFYLSFENSRCQDYITEKLSNPLKLGMVPVVMGPNRATYERVAPPNSFIHVDDFRSPRELAEYLHYLMSNGTAYMKYFSWRKYYRVVDSPGWCNLCRYLNEKLERKSYEDIQEWWFDACGTRNS